MVQMMRHIELRYDHGDSHNSAMRLVLALFPEWERSKDTIEFVRFKDGITNTLFKAINKRPGLSEQQIDQEAVLIRAYGSGTQVLIDRDRECASHSLLSSQKLAPALLARFDNGLMYRYIPGRVCQPADLRKPEVWRGVARRLAEWHASLPLAAVAFEHGVPSDHPSRKQDPKVDKIERLTPGKPSPNIWGVIQRWILALPSENEKDLARRNQLQQELEWLVKEVGDIPGIAGRPLVFGHCDLLSANVIIKNEVAFSSTTTSKLNGLAEDKPALNVNFIDYEYATPCPAAFDIANHFAEWGGFECDFSVLPTRHQRRDFLEAYYHAFNLLLDRQFERAELDQLCNEVDTFRGAPGFYWGIWALIQAQISQIDFNYSEYADIRLGEYWAWKENMAAGNIVGSDSPLRERRWAQEQD